MQVTKVIPHWTVGDRLRKAREHAGLDQAAFAAAVGISRGTVQNYEADRFGKTRSTPGSLQLRAWALATGVPVEWLLTGDVHQGAPDAAVVGASQNVLDVPRKGETAGQGGTEAYCAAAGHTRVLPGCSNGSRRRLALVRPISHEVPRTDDLGALSA